MFNFLPANYDPTQYILDFLVNKATSPGSRRCRKWSNPKYLTMNSRLSKVRSNVNLTLKILILQCTIPVAPACASQEASHGNISITKRGIIVPLVSNWCKWSKMVQNAQRRLENIETGQRWTNRSKLVHSGPK